MKCTIEEAPNTCVFDEKSTYLNDYRWCDPDQFKIQKWPKERCPTPPKGPRRGEFRPVPEGYKDTQTLFEWKKDAKVPFYLYLEPKECVNTDPTKFPEIPLKQKEQFDERERTQKLNSIKTRPRLYVSPAVSVDDIEDPAVRKILIDYTYITDWEKSARESCLPVNPVKFIPDTSAYKTPKTELEVKTQSTIPRHLRQETKKWDSKQTRACIDPAEVFWKRQEPIPPTLDLIGTLVPNETRKEIRQLIETDMLRKEHDKLMPSYSGHVPLMNPGLPLKTNDFPVEHPMVSQSQAVKIRYRNVKRCL